MAVLRAGLAALANSKDSEELIVQIVLGAAYRPAPLSYGLQDPTASWLEIISGDVKRATFDMTKSVREKSAQAGFQ